MKCLSPRKIVTRSKYLSLLHQQPYVIEVPCNHCSECRKRQKSEWYFRIYHEWLSTYNHGGYVFFQTLTYNDSNLPTLRDELRKYNFDCNYDVPCFSRIDLDLFFKRLRRTCERRGVDVAHNLRYWICGEYGADDRYSHRPHYHVLFFVTTDKMSVFDLQRNVEDSWKLGFVDRLRLTGKNANYFPCVDGPNLGLSNYVAKYVQKSSSFESVIMDRIDSALDSYIDDIATIFRPLHFSEYEDFNDSVYNRAYRPMRVVDMKVVFDGDEAHRWKNTHKFRKFRNRVIRLVNQFHNQSQGFGLSALDSIDIADYLDKGYVTMPDKKYVLKKIALPKYYRQKLFYEKKIVNGDKVFVRNKLGKIAYNRSLSRAFEKLKSDYLIHRDINHYLPAEVDVDALARYVVYRRGRIDGDLSNYVGADEIFGSSFCLYNYVCPNHVARFHGRYVSSVAAHCGDYFFHDGLRDCLSVDVFIKKFVFFDAYYENILSHLDVDLHKSDKVKQDFFDYNQDYRNRLQMCLSF